MPKNMTGRAATSGPQSEPISLHPTTLESLREPLRSGARWRQAGGGGR